MRRWRAGPAGAVGDPWKSSPAAHGRSTRAGPTAGGPASRPLRGDGAGVRWPPAPVAAVGRRARGWRDGAPQAREDDRARRGRGSEGRDPARGLAGDATPTGSPRGSGPGPSGARHGRRPGPAGRFPRVALGPSPDDRHRRAQHLPGAPRRRRVRGRRGVAGGHPHRRRARRDDRVTLVTIRLVGARDRQRAAELEDTARLIQSLSRGLARRGRGGDRRRGGLRDRRRPRRHRPPSSARVGARRHPRQRGRRGRPVDDDPPLDGPGAGRPAGGSLGAPARVARRGRLRPQAHDRRATRGGLRARRRDRAVASHRPALGRRRAAAPRRVGGRGVGGARAAYTLSDAEARAQTDPLTGLPNRRRFDEVARDIAGRGGPATGWGSS